MPAKIILGQNKTYILNNADVMSNNNALIVGSSGTGKTTGIMIPNILQGEQSPIISDPKGSILENYGSELERLYDLRVLNIKNLSESMHYNPVKYCNCEEDVIFLASCICNALPSGGTRSPGLDTFWMESAKNLITALISYVCQHVPKELRTMNTVTDLFQLVEMKNEDYIQEDSLDKLMNTADDFTKRFYGQYKVSVGRTRQSILTETMSMLTSWMLSDVREMLRYDEMNLMDFCTQPYHNRYPALILVADDINPEKNFLSRILYSQILKITCGWADVSERKSLDIPLRFYLDDFATVGQIPHFENIISNIRSRNISVMIATQNESQLYDIYGNAAKTIIGNCNYYIFTGSSDLVCRKEVAERFNFSLKQITHFNRQQSLIDAGGDQFTVKKLNPYYNTDMAKIRKQKTEEEYLESPYHSFRTHYDKDTYDMAMGMTLSGLKYSFENHIREKLSEEILDAERTTSETETPQIAVRTSMFDSICEEAFYMHLMDYIGNNEKIAVETHVHLSEMFEDKDIDRKKGKEKYRLVNMHCDFALFDKITRRPYCGIEIDGPSHNDLEQIERDVFKDAIFENNHIKLFRINAQDAYEIPKELGRFIDGIIEEGSFDADLSLYYDELTDSDMNEDTVTGDASGAVAADETDLWNDNIKNAVNM